MTQQREPAVEGFRAEGYDRPFCLFKGGENALPCAWFDIPGSPDPAGRINAGDYPSHATERVLRKDRET